MNVVIGASIVSNDDLFVYTHNYNFKNNELRVCVDGSCEQHRTFPRSDLSCSSETPKRTLVVAPTRMNSALLAILAYTVRGCEKFKQVRECFAKGSQENQ